MELSYAQKREIFEKGYVKVPGVVPQVLVDAALRAINNSLGQGMKEEDVVKFRSQSYCPELTRTPVISDLLNKTPAWEYAESLIGPGALYSVDGGQIALRFPTMQDPAPPFRPHLDGMYSPTNGVPEGTIRNFTLLVGVSLSDVLQPYSGNFTVWPGTHYLYQDYFREHGPKSLLNGMPPIEMPEPEQILARAGDVVFCHYQVAHTAGPNLSPDIRYAIYFRLYHQDHGEWCGECMTDIWREWAGMRAFTE
jgi:hypothetical protein